MNSAVHKDNYFRYLAFNILVTKYLADFSKATKSSVKILRF